MQIDRRITNGLAWAGAILVVAIPVADYALQQVSPDTAPQVAVIQQEDAEPEARPTPVAERPTPAVDEAEAEAPVTDPVVTATTPSRGSGAAVDNFLESGRDLPSYISGGTATAAPARPTTPPSAVASPPPVITTPAPATTPQPVTATRPAAPAVPQTATAPVPAKPVTLPTPVSQRPTPVAVAPQPVPLAPSPIQPSAPRPPLIVEEPNGVTTATDLDEWETGPLSDFLASRNGRQEQPADYDDGGFFLDEVPANDRQEPLPRAYGEGFYYPFSD